MDVRLISKLRLSFFISASVGITLASLSFVIWHIIAKPSIRNNSELYLKKINFKSIIAWDDLSVAPDGLISFPDIKLTRKNIVIHLQGLSLAFHFPKLLSGDIVWPISLTAKKVSVDLAEISTSNLKNENEIIAKNLTQSNWQTIAKTLLNLILNPDLAISIHINELLLDYQQNQTLSFKDLRYFQNGQLANIYIANFNGSWVKQQSSLKGQLNYIPNENYILTFNQETQSGIDDFFKISISENFDSINLFTKQTGIPQTLQSITRNFIQNPSKLRYALRINTNLDSTQVWQFDIQAAITNLSLANDNLAIKSLDRTPLILKTKGTYNPQKNFYSSVGRLALVDPENKTKRIQINFQASSSSLKERIDGENLHFRLSMQPTSCQKILTTLPRQLLGPLVDFKAMGYFGFDVGLVLPYSRWENFKYKVNQFDYGCRFKTEQYLFSRDFLRDRVFLNSGSDTIDNFKPQFLAFLSSKFTRNYGPHLADLMVTAEDTGYWSHKGYEPYALIAAIRKYLSEGKPKLGGSTITMQVARNLYLHHNKTLARKFQELILSQYLENMLTKKEILDIYANIIEYGPQLYGVMDASQALFSLHPSQLSLTQSAFLVSALPQPSKITTSFCANQLEASLKRRTEMILSRFHHLTRQRGHELLGKQISLDLYPLNFSNSSKYRELICKRQQSIAGDEIYSPSTIEMKSVAWPVPDPPTSGKL